VKSIQADDFLIGGTGLCGEMKKGIFRFLKLISFLTKNRFFPCIAPQMWARTEILPISWAFSGLEKLHFQLILKPWTHRRDEHADFQMGVFNFEGGIAMRK